MAGDFYHRKLKTMPLHVDVHLSYGVIAPTDILAQVRVAATVEQRLISEVLDVPGTLHHADVIADDNIGVRTWVRVSDTLDFRYACTVEIERADIDIAALPAVPPHLLPGEAVRYLMPSRYCPSDQFQSYVGAEFSSLQGGARVAAMRDWIVDKIQYVSGSSDARTTALDTFVQRRGVCRDFAHVMISLCRASAIPARFASVYAPHVTPQDFHAVAEVFLDGRWYLIDSTGMARPSEMAVVGVGMDAGAVAFLTSFGPIALLNQSVSVVQSA